MQLFVIESTEEKTIETQKETTINLDVSKLEDNEKSDLLNELFRNMSDQEIEDCVDYDDRMLKVILRNHVYITDKQIRNMVYILEGDVDHKDLKRDLKALIQKYNLQDEL